MVAQGAIDPSSPRPVARYDRMTPCPLPIPPMSFLSSPHAPSSRPMPARRTLHRAALVLTCAALLACSPTFDWRDVRDQGATALFPDKTQSVARGVELGGVSVTMTMQATRVAGLSFALARVDLPAGADAATLRPKVLAGLREALGRNINGKVVAQGKVNVARVERGAAPIEGEFIEAAGQGGGQALSLQARLVGTDTRVWQIAVYGGRDDMAKPVAREAVETFLLSLRLD